MASLKEGAQYELLSTTAAGSGKVTVVHVKLTDTALRAIEDFHDFARKSRQNNSTVRSTIQFKGSHGVIQIPVRQSSNCKKFGFTLSAVEQKDGSLECICHGDGKSSRCLSSIGVMSHNLRVQATDDVYQTTKEKISLAEEESKKVRTQTIEESGPNISRKVKKIGSSKVAQVSQPMPLKTPSARGRPRRAALSQPMQSMSEPRTGSSKKVAPNVLANSRKSDVPINASQTDSLTLRDRIIHLLALRAYKHPELILRLQRDGCRPDVNSVRSILDEIAHCNRDSYTLHKHICVTEVRPNWPLYTDEDRAAINKKLSQLLEQPMADAPALSPCSSTGDRNSLRRQQSQKRQAVVLDNDINGVMPNSKKPRVAHVRPTITDSSKDQPATTAASRQQKSASNSADSSIGGSEDDFVDKYKPIQSYNQRHQYKEDFQAEYTEYMQLFRKTERQMEIFHELGKNLTQHSSGSAGYENIKQRIKDEYVKLHSNTSYGVDRRRLDYLHRKLAHIKRLVSEYDASVA